MVERGERALNIWKKSLAKHKNSSELSFHIIVDYRKGCSPKRCEGGHITVFPDPLPCLPPGSMESIHVSAGQRSTRFQIPTGKRKVAAGTGRLWPVPRSRPPRRLGRSIYCFDFGERGRESSSKEIILKCLINSNLVICK